MIEELTPTDVNYLTEEEKNIIQNSAQEAIVSRKRIRIFLDNNQIMVAGVDPETSDIPKVNSILEVISDKSRPVIWYDPINFINQ
jgi:hypothetical protein